ncbi:hypothetical protein [Nannocystis pusilla]|uniref:hypothetical protein n=1 Tax=Nannocystis pusilla TaxID=889268 RepID=UPI003DA5620F
MADVRKPPPPRAAPPQAPAPRTSRPAAGGQAQAPRVTPNVAELERQVGSLALSQIDGAGALAMMRALVWQGILARLGVAVPLVILHDLGCLITGLGGPGPVVKGIAESELCEAWRGLLVELGESDLVRAQAGWKHRDQMIGVVLARVFAPVVPQLPDDVRVLRPIELPVDAVHYAKVEPSSAYTRYDQRQTIAWLQTLTTHRLLPLLAVEQIDVDALRLFGLFRGGPGEAAAGVDLADLYNVMVSPALADVIDFSMELLPSILEVKREAGQQVFSIDGYASIERFGGVDDLELSQLAYDEDIFEQKFIDDELFYFTHEKQVENEHRTHYVLVDGSASMRGVREVFARGLALALCKRLALLGEHVILRFFDSRLYEGVKVGAQGHAEVPYVLQFRAEHGRNYARVIRQINAELSAPRRSGGGGGGKVLVYLLTHGECQLPPDDVAALAARAPIYGVFILPSSGVLDLGYLDLFYRVHVIDDQAISHGRRAQRARQIISDVEAGHRQAQTTRRKTGAPKTMSVGTGLKGQGRRRR